MLCWAACFTVFSSGKAQNLATGQLDPTQVYTTGNVVQPTVAGTGSTPWVNGVYQDNLTCWAWGDPGYCGPNPIVRPGNNINFSFGMTDLYQQQSIANILPNTGTGLRVNGYNFSFTAKNGNGWDNGQVDNLTAYVNFYGSNGSLVVNDVYALTYKYDWTNFSFNQTFNSPYLTSNLSSVRYGFVGNDSNYWAGPYGPEIYNVNFSLKYSVDPCSVSVLSSPSCPGYADYLASLNTIATPSVPTINTTSTGTQVTEPVSNTVVASSALTPTTTTNTTSEPAASTSTTSTAAQVNPTAAATGTTQTVAVSATPTPSANNPQPKVGEVSQSSSPKSTVSTSQILSIVANEQSRISSVEKSAVEATTQQAAQAASSATQQAESVAGQAQSQSITASVQAAQAAEQTAQNSANLGTGLTVNAPSVVQSNILPGGQNQQNNSALAIKGPEIQSSPIDYGLPQVISNVPTNIVSSTVDSSMSVIEKITTTIETTQTASIDRQLLERIERPTLQSDTKSTQPAGPSVNQRVRDNAAAGTVTLESITAQPQGFELYMAAMQDSKFYAPKEIYRGQRNVDNQRLLRGLTGGSDRLHRQMIEQQYQLGQ